MSSMFELILRVCCCCLALAGVETVHGIARMRLLVPRIGLQRAQRVSIVSGSLLAFAVCFLMVPPLGLRQRSQLLLLGAVLAGFMAGFDMIIGRYAARRPWSRVVEDFDPRRGNLLLFGLAFLVLCPLLVMTVRLRTGSL